MQIKIFDGSMAEVEVGSLIERVPSSKSSPEEGALEVVGFDTDYPVVMIDGVKTAVSGDTIAMATSKPEPIESVDLGGGNMVTVPAKSAEIIRDMLAAQAVLMDQIKDLQSGGTVADLLKQVESLKQDNEKMSAVLESLKSLRDRMMDAHKATGEFVGMVDSL